MSRAPSPSGSTLLQILQRANPDIIDEWGGKSYENTKSKTQSFDEVDVAKPWTDLTYDAILLAYGDILDKDIKTLQQHYVAPAPLTRTPTIITAEDSVDMLGFAWSTNIVRGPLKGAATVLRQRFSGGGRQNRPDFPSETHHVDQASRAFNQDEARLG
jgi:hypothetical protein